MSHQSEVWVRVLLEGHVTNTYVAVTRERYKLRRIAHNSEDQVNKQGNPQVAESAIAHT